MARTVLIGSRTADGCVILPPAEPSPKIRTMYPCSRNLRARPTTFASPTSARKTETPNASAILSVRMEVGSFTATAALDSLVPIRTRWASSETQARAKTSCASSARTIPFASSQMTKFPLSPSQSGI